jgi:hypothetical protein
MAFPIALLLVNLPTATSIFFLAFVTLLAFRIN